VDPLEAVLAVDHRRREIRASRFLGITIAIRRFTSPTDRQAAWVNEVLRIVEHIAVEVRVASAVPQRVGLQPAAEGGGEVAVAEVVEVDDVVVAATLVQVAPVVFAGRARVP
jgi:hypothetical protein